MTRFLALVFLLVSLAGCAPLFGTSNADRARLELWEDALAAFEAGEFHSAEFAFQRLAEDLDTVEGRESLFYLGALHLDPRNPEWDSVPAEERLAEYLAFMRPDGPRLFRYPEARTLHGLAHQLNLPPASRVGPLQPDEHVVVTERVIVPADESRRLAAENEQLRQELAARAERISQLQDELDRIRRTLTGQ